MSQPTESKHSTNPTRKITTGLLMEGVLACCSIFSNCPTTGSGQTILGLAFNIQQMFTGSIARSATRRYLSYSPILRVFTPKGRHAAPMGVKFGIEVEYKRPTGAYPLSDFHKICRVCTPFQDSLGVKISSNLLKGIWSYRGFKVRVSDYPQIFTAP